MDDKKKPKPQKGRDVPLAPTSQPKPVSNAQLTPPNTGGTYVAYSNGRVGRYNGMSGPYESMDTSGYSSGKKEFELKKSYSGYKPNVSKISRKDVPAKIQEFKKGATRSQVEKPSKFKN
jgi:hypothetical protein